MNRNSTLLILVLGVFSTSGFAKPSMDSEIKHLLKVLKTTSCIVERNGKTHNGKKAFKHINKKYKHFAAEIDSTEKFIELSATKSLRSGKYYKIKCDSKSERRLADWLKTKLAQYRK